MVGLIGAKRLAIVADDLTGALDCAVAFVGNGEPPFVALAPGTEPPAGCGALSVNADTRRLAVPDAANVIQDVARGVGEADRQLRYVKIDSTLRGHPGVEIAECAEQDSASLVILAPAFPAVGRVVADGQMLVNGVPLVETDVGRDPLSPVTSSDVAEVLQRSTDLPVQKVPLQQVRSNALLDQLASLAEDSGARSVIACCDAETDEELDALIAAGVELEPRLKVLFAGSAGLAFALGRSLQHDASPADNIAPPHFNGPALVVTASQRALAGRQIDALVQEGVADLQPIDFSVTRSGEVTHRQIDTQTTDRALATGRNLVLRARVQTDLEALPPASVRSIADAVTTQLARIVTGIVSRRPVGGIVIVGGDTAHATLAAANARGIVLAAEPLPGVPVGAVSGGVLDGVPIATKAGAFGDDQTLLRLLTLMRPEDRPE